MEYWDDILAIYGGVVAICTVIVKLTPSTKDDEILGKIILFLDTFSTAFRKADEEKLKQHDKA
jgi:hypothetical protein